MAGNLMKRAAAYRKTHKSLSMQEAVSKVAAMDRAGKKPAAKKKAAVKKVAKKKPAARKKAAPKKRAVAKKAVGRVHKKKAAARPAAAQAMPVRKKVKTKVKGRKTVVTISGISINKVQQELGHQHSLTIALDKHKLLLKERGLSPGEKAQLKRDITHYKNLINSSKAHVRDLKRSI